MFRKIFNKSLFVSDGIKKIGQQMIDNPLDWEQGRYEFTNTKHTDVSIWTCNGIFFMQINGLKALSLLEKIYLNNCIKISIANRLAQSV